MDFPKKQAQRLMPLYLLEYSEKLFENHPNPEDPWGGGSDYTAGDGIDITNDVISVDNTIARKSDIPSLTGYATEQWVLDKGYITSIDLLGYATEQWVQNQGYSTFSGSYNDLTDKPDFNNYYYLNNNIQSGNYTTSINERGLEYSKEWNDNKISIVSDYSGSEQWLSGKAVIVIENTNSKTAISDSIGVFNSSYNQGVIVDHDKVEVTNRMDNTSTSLKSGEIYYLGLNGGFDFNLPTSKSSGTYTLATTDDIPSLTGYATEQWVQNQGYLTSAALTNYVTTTQLEDALDDYALKTDIPENVSDLNNDAGYTTQTWVQNQGYITGINSSDVITALGYTPGTSNFSGNYNDLTNKPTIPTVTNDLISVNLGIIGTSGTLSNDLYNALTANPEKTIVYTNSYGGGNRVQLFYESGTASDLYYSGMSKMAAQPGEPNKWYHYVLRIGLDTLSEIGEKHYTLNNVDTGVALKQNLATVATSGSYNDLSNKPAIPDAVSGTNDGTNWTSLTVGNDTYAIPQGGSTPSMIGKVLYTDRTTTVTGKDIVLSDSADNYDYLDIVMSTSDNSFTTSFTTERIYKDSGTSTTFVGKCFTNKIMGEWDGGTGQGYNKIGYYTFTSNTNIQVSGCGTTGTYKQMRWISKNGSTSPSRETNGTDGQRWVKITKVIGYKANSSALITETWTFTLQDGTTITKNIVTA